MSKTDKEQANIYRERLKMLAEPIIDLLKEAKGDDFDLSFNIDIVPEPPVLKIIVRKITEL